MKERFKKYRTNEGTLPLTVASFGESGVHLSDGVVRWADEALRNESTLERILSKHDKRMRARHEEDLCGPPGTEVYTSHRAPNAGDDIIITTEFDARGRGFSWAAFTSEF